MSTSRRAGNSGNLPTPASVNNGLARSEAQPHFPCMRKRKSASPYAVPFMMAQLAATSWETILRRTTKMAHGTCSPAEYRRMTAEKVAAVQRSATALARGGGAAGALAPFLKRTKANVRRLRRSR